jgi:integrase
VEVAKEIWQALSHAVKWGLVGLNVADAIDPPRAADREMSALDPSGVERVMNAARGTRYYPLFSLATFTGMRRSELLALRWKDVDSSKRTVSIARCCIVYLVAGSYSSNRRRPRAGAW